MSTEIKSILDGIEIKAQYKDIKFISESKISYLVSIGKIDRIRGGGLYVVKTKTTCYSPLKALRLAGY